ncbi:hypothetical protein BSKO_09545 [Bryopsis sp. KO-2023]|nr:hypothetical protein BSKO_09545 [Bryopsis sp. KO-2023]
MQGSRVGRIGGLSYRRQAVAASRRPISGSVSPCKMSMLGQNFNSAGIRLFFKVTAGDKRLAVPHISVPDISFVRWDALRDAGFQGCVMDKDNTLTDPYGKALNPKIRTSLAECRKVLPVVLFSNSAGLEQFDPQGEEATALEGSLGIPVLRHKEKKPAGGVSELESHFGCSAEKLIMVGDRYLTDVVFGNRNQMFTIYVAPFDTAREPLGVKMARRLEDTMVAKWRNGGVQSPPHPFFTVDSAGFVKN